MGKVLKALGGAALGIVTVACLPIAGPVGAISLAGAAIAGTVGGSAGVIADSLEKDKKLQAYNQGREYGKEEAYWEIEEQKVKLKNAAERFIEHKELEDLLYAIFAVGISVSACDGEISPAERQQLREFIFGTGFEELPEDVKDGIIALENDPPDYNQAMDYVKKLKNSKTGIVDGVIN